ncbi:hypothetical protein DPEC_G00121310 [Dallia pectoralis]|uniref:Uncharacterized protein n=1 Tax=Dallia pectoralis TaxID=75939 RepID=A0ACC2GQD6_DALPE|nr:hypothetical protein DPEC_G00121310 [Dallia pectoralis]
MSLIHLSSLLSVPVWKCNFFICGPKALRLKGKMKWGDSGPRAKIKEQDTELVVERVKERISWMEGGRKELGRAMGTDEARSGEERSNMDKTRGVEWSAHCNFIICGFLRDSGREGRKSQKEGGVI